MDGWISVCVDGWMDGWLSIIIMDMNMHMDTELIPWDLVIRYIQHQFDYNNNMIRLEWILLR